LIRPAGDPRSPLGNLVGWLNGTISMSGMFEKRRRVTAKPLTFLPPRDLGGQPVAPLSFGMSSCLEFAPQEERENAHLQQAQQQAAELRY